MAELHVQPKKKKSVLPWVLLVLGIIALTWFLLSRRDTNAYESTSENTPGVDQAPSGAGWETVDLNAPAVQYAEVTSKNITVRGNEAYTIYGVDESALFDEGKAELRSDAAQNLQPVVTSISQRHADGSIRIFGFTDPHGDSATNSQLAERRIHTVQAWLVSNGIAASRVSLSPLGMSQPIGDKASTQARQGFKRIEIVARNPAQ